MIEILGLFLGGGATGIAGSLLGRVFGFFERRDEHRRELDLRRLDIELAQQEAASAERIAEISAAAQVDAAHETALAESYRHAAARVSAPGERGVVVWADAARMLTRPVVTVGLLVLDALIYFTTDDLGLQRTLVEGAVYYTGLALSWWFADRRAARGGPR